MSRVGGSRFDQAQHLVLRASKAEAVLHQVVRFESAEGGRSFIEAVLDKLPPSFGTARPTPSQPQVTIGLTFRGLETLKVPDGYLHVFRRLSPPFAEGAPARAVRHLGDVGASAPGFWDIPFALEHAHAVVTVHGTQMQCEAALTTLIDLMRGRAEPKVGKEAKVAKEEAPNATPVGPPLCGKHLEPPHGRQAQEGTHWVHFGYRDGLTNPVVAGAGDTAGKPDVHEPGELLLGEVRDTGDNPWSLVQLRQEVRDLAKAFFHQGSFGVLRQIEQDEKAFRHAVERWAGVLASDRGYRLARRKGDKVPVSWPADKVEAFVRAKLCGRWPDGQVITPDHEPPYVPNGTPEPKFPFEGDAHGAGCPFGAHIRRMHPRSSSDTGDGRAAHVRPRALFRRGMPFGPWFDEEAEKQKETERGLLGLFFCTDLADQFEHLLGEWADRLPLGFPGDRLGKDPLIGAHDDLQASLLVPRRMPVDPDTGKEPPDPSPLALYGFRPFVRTRGTVYAFYPPFKALERLANVKPDWTKEEEQWLV